MCRLVTKWEVLTLVINRGANLSSLSQRLHTERSSAVLFFSVIKNKFGFHFHVYCWVLVQLND